MNLNSNQAMKIPQSLSVNNTDHSKGMNVFLLGDRICGKSRSNLQSWLSAVSILSTYNIEKQKSVNYKSVITELSKSLNKIKYQLVLDRVLDLLQTKGNESTVHNLKRFIATIQFPKNIHDAYLDHNNLNLIHRECTQIKLKECIFNIEKNIKINTIVSDRKPFKRLMGYHRSQIKSANRSIERPSLVSKTNQMMTNKDNDHAGNSRK